MSNTDHAYGLVPIESPGGTITTHAYKKTASTALYLGDPVKRVAAGTVERAAAGDSFIGACVSIMDPDGVPVNYVPASDSDSDYTVMVSDDPDQFYMCQEDSDGAALALADRGINCDLVIADGDSDTGQSGVEIDSSTKATTSAQVRLIDIVERYDNAVGDNADWIVRIVEHQDRSATGV